ncbi:hypothetical protein ABFX02_05G082700 [Erythranthe guttata]
MVSSDHEAYDNLVRKKLEAPMPWIGLYVAAATALCTLAMAADALRGFRSRRFWFPCKYFSLNAFSLTLLAVAMKLLVDLTNFVVGVNDQIAGVSSLVLMSTAMANFTTNDEIAVNLAALSILVITITGNVCIHIVQTRHFLFVRDILAEEVGSTFVMLLLLLILCSSAVVVPTAKRRVVVSNNKKVEVAVRRYWVMAETGSSQFVIARSVGSVFSGLVCLLMGLTLLEAHIRMPLVYDNFVRTHSSYKWSVNWILVVQAIGVALGTIAPLMRWFIAARFKSFEMGRKSFKDEFKVESYWTQILVDWRESPVPLQIRSHKFKKLLHDVKGLLLNFCIGVQIAIVLASKLVLLLSATFLNGLLFIKNRKTCCCFKESRTGTGSLDYSSYVLLLEGESKLPQKTLTNICNEADKLIQIGRKKQSKNLVELVKKSVNFNGVREFDSDEVPILQYHQEPPNCWSLPVVTLTSIAISLPNVSDRKRNFLLSSASRGLYFVKLVEKSLDRNGDSAIIRHAADVVWVGVELSKKWQDKDLQSASLGGGSHKETLQNLSDTAEKIVIDFTTETKDPLMMQNPLIWPVKVIAARSMYRITQTIMLVHKDDHSLTNEELFERLSVMISDIFAACLTNLVSVIILKCHSNAIEEREESVRQAAILLGESEEILEILEKRELPRLDPNKAGDIEEWRAFMEWNPPGSVSASSNNGTENPQSNVEQVSVEIRG